MAAFATALGGVELSGEVEAYAMGIAQNALLGFNGLVKWQNCFSSLCVKTPINFSIISPVSYKIQRNILSL